MSPTRVSPLDGNGPTRQPVLMTRRGWTAATAYVLLVQTIAVLNVVRSGSGALFFLGLLLTLPVGALVYPLYFALALVLIVLRVPTYSLVADVGLSLLFGIGAAANVWVVRSLATGLRGAWRRCRLRPGAQLLT